MKRLFLLLSYYADSLLNVAAVFDFVYHSDRVIGIGNNAFAFVVESELLARKNVLACSFAVSLKITRGTDECPLDVVSLTQLVKLRTLRVC